METSGLDPAFDQVLTFAGIRTDSRLREIDRTRLTLRLRCDVIPSPEAAITHCLTPDDLSDGLCEYQAAQKLHALFNTPDTVSLGYNSFGFDDEFLRFFFYRNLLEPYTHQYADGCSRGDILPVTALYNRFCEPPVIRWPRLEGNKSTLKLEHIARENQFDTSGPAHDAMSDVEALVQLCRRFAGRTDMWAYALGFFDKATDLKRMQGIADTCRIRDRFFRNALMISASFGSTAGYLAPVLHIGGAVPYANQQLWIRLDQPGYQEIDPDTRRFDWFPIRKKPADAWLVLPPLDRFTQKLSNDARQTAARVIAMFRENCSEFLDTVQAHREFAYPWIPALDPDAALYQEGFFTAAEKKDIARFHDAGPFETKEAQTLSRLPATLHTPRVQALAARILTRNYLVPASPEFQAHLEKLSSGGSIAGFRSEEKRTLPQAKAGLKDIASHRDTLNSRQRRALDGIDAYLREWAI
ncbi:MAG: exonuclease domain-containing protein [Desulfotignum sp.]